MKREIIIKLKDGSEKRLELSKATKLKMDASLLHLDKLKDGTWRLIWSEDIVDQFSDIDFIDINRED
jgi:hypothetical protein